MSQFLPLKQLILELAPYCELSHYKFAELSPRAPSPNKPRLTFRNNRGFPSSPQATDGQQDAETLSKEKDDLASKQLGIDFFLCLYGCTSTRTRDTQESYRKLTK